ncbi:PREDICTED: uncharacterized protein K02A2.6-like [Wasmannia auropunctata]|uniref:uncharacterized protein K02A2.6-like n=1 Tax=Wasmannia auropunctata TaxID=64793 RepID=UPI0005F05792|nr:PREDICTED: uncharacterized protein K02A2.6-like [Wasmannia auropunctata]
MRSPSNADIRTKLLNKIDSKPSTLTIEDLTIECQRFINLKADTSLGKTQKGTVAAIKDDKNIAKQNKTFKFNNKGKKGTHQTQPHKNKSTNSQKIPSTPCWFCGLLHYSKDCTYKNHKCKKCNEVGHKDGYCYSSKRTASNSLIKKLQSQQTNVTSIVNHVSTIPLRKFVNVKINSHPVKLQFDTGSDITVISQNTWYSLRQPQTQVSKHIARDASDWLNEFNLWKCSFDIFCYHVAHSSNHIHSFQLDTLKQKFPEVFKPGLGRCTKTKVHLYQKPDARPVFRPKRPVAYSILPVVDAELTRLGQAGIITPVNYYWATPIVVVRKNNKTCICADYSTGLNNSLEPNRHPLPHPDEIFAKLSNCKYYSHIDFSDAFLQIEVDEQSRHLLTINTHKGLYIYNRLPFGVTTAPGKFQAIVDSMIAGLDNIFAYIDDIVIGETTEQEHNQNLFKLFEHPNKISAIVNMPVPTNVTMLRAFLGAINYYGRFMSHMHTLKQLLNLLLKQNLMLQTTALALASCINFQTTQSKQFVTLLAALQKPKKIQKFTLQTDHKSLLSIFGLKKGILVHTANRLQRWALQLLAYDFQIQYVKTMDFGHADVLSRLISQQQKPDEETVIASIHLEEDISAALQNSLQNIPVTFKEIQEAIKVDLIMQQAIQFTLTGWLTSLDEPQLKALHRRREDLTVVQDCLMLQDRIVIPILYQNQILKRAHIVS